MFKKFVNRGRIMASTMNCGGTKCEKYRKACVLIQKVETLNLIISYEKLTVKCSGLKEPT